jgi:hypothetical protein
MLIVQFSERNMHRFLNDLHIVEALNEPVDDSGSEGAKLFVNMGNVFCADFFSLNFFGFLNKFFMCFYRNIMCQSYIQIKVRIFISQNTVQIFQYTHYTLDS